MKKNVLYNIISLYGLSIAKIIFPLITLPYLTRVLSVETYGMVSYVKTLMIYFQLIVDFGFVLSGTKDIVNSKEDIKRMESEIGDILFARIILALFAFFCLLIIILHFPVLEEYKVYSLLAFIPVFLSIFLFDFVFRGLEKMQVITTRFFIMKSISVIFTLVFVKGDAEIIWIPILEIISSIVAIVLVGVYLKKIGIRISRTNIYNSIKKLKKSFIYFFSNMATTVFSALNTILIGIFLQKEDIAYWSLCIQIISTIQALYTPIIEGVYPSMIKKKEFKQIRNMLFIFMPIVIIGCIFTYCISDYALLIIGGQKYISASVILRLLIPVLFFGFPAMLFGWPTLGAINQQKSVTVSTILAATFQILSLIILVCVNQISIIAIAIVRSITECILFITRTVFCYRYRRSFN